MSPFLILVSGSPGAGKSTFGQLLAPHLKATYLDKDYIDDEFSPDDRGRQYTRDIEPRVLRGLLNLADLNLKLGNHVILDVPWTHIMLNAPDWVGIVQMTAHQRHAKLVVFECVIPEKALFERIKKRGLKRDEPKLTERGWIQFQNTDRLGEKNPLPHQTIDTTQPPEACVQTALTYIAQLKETCI